MLVGHHGTGKSSSIDQSIKKILAELDDLGDDLPQPDSDDSDTVYSRYRGKGITKPKPSKTSIKSNRKRNKSAKKKNRVK